MRPILAALLLAVWASAQAANPFGTQARLDAHYKKHVIVQREFGDISKEKYAAAAVRLRDAKPDGKIVFHRKRSDGSSVKFDKRTGEFGAYRGKLTLTHFRPRKGWSYFQRQR